MSVIDSSYRIEQISAVPEIYHIDTSHNDGAVHRNLARKLVKQEELEALGTFHRARGDKIVFLSGTMDMIHIGHGRFMDLGRNLGDMLVVGVNTDVSVKAYKDPTRPFLGELKRAEMLAYLTCVDYMSFYDETTADGLIRLLKPDYYLCAEGTWPEGTELKDKPEVVAMAEHGGKIFVSPRQDPELSTSAIFQRIKGFGVEEATRRIIEILNSQQVQSVKTPL